MEKKKRIVIGPSSFGDSDPSVMERLALEGLEAIKNPFGRKLTKAELIQILPGASGIIAGLETLDREVLEQSELKVISRCGAGIDNVDVKAANELGIRLYSTPDAPTIAVAELAIGALFSLLRFIPQMNKDLHGGGWKKRTGRQLNGKTVAIIGFGRIGRHMAKLLQAFTVKVMAVDPNINTVDSSSERVEFVTLRKALSSADIVMLHAKGDAEILGEKEFKLMKKGVFLLNCARGSLINESALIKAIEDGQIAGVWLDTFKEEPYKGPLIKYEGVLLTPHAGSYSYECRNRMESEAVDNLIRGFKEGLKSVR